MNETTIQEVNPAIFLICFPILGLILIVYHCVKNKNKYIELFPKEKPYSSPSQQV